jgi:hypothetical protein
VHQLASKIRFDCRGSEETKETLLLSGGMRHREKAPHNGAFFSFTDLPD